jgi:hypothetical protein
MTRAPAQTHSGADRRLPDTDLIGPFFPMDTKPNDKLGPYAKRFAVVEVDSTNTVCSVSDRVVAGGLARGQVPP